MGTAEREGSRSHIWPAFDQNAYHILFLCIALAAVARGEWCNVDRMYDRLSEANWVLDLALCKLMHLVKPEKITERL